MNKKHTVNVNVEGRLHDFEIYGNNEWGEEDRLLVEEDDNLTKNTSFENSGYIVTKFLSKQDNKNLKESLRQILCDKLYEILGVKLSTDELINYHEIVSAKEHSNFT